MWTQAISCTHPIRNYRYHCHDTSQAYHVHHALYSFIFLFSHFSQSLVSFWMGLEDNAIEGEFRWKDGNSFEYRNWAIDEPNNGGGAQYCAHFLMYPGWSYDTFGLWDDMECYESLSFVCKMPARGNLVENV